MTLLSLYNSRTQPTATHEQPKQHRSSSAFIAHLLVQEYPPKVQPQSSSARDKALYGHLDKVDAEAGCILIALANHDKRKDMNDLIPYSIRVVDFNQTKTMETTDSTYETLETASGENRSSSSSSSNYIDSSISNDTIRDAENDDPSLDEGDSNGTMSIKNLIDVNNESPSSSDTPALCEKTNPLSQTIQQPSLSPSTSSISLSSSSIPTTTTPSSNIQHNDGNDQSKTKSSCKPEPRTDPILLLAAAAKAIDQGELLNQEANQKRKYSNDDSSLESRSPSARRPRYTRENQPALDQPLQSDKSKFSHQYLSMKQNPKIMRNAMHAYISYMIYADLTSSDKVSHCQNQGISSSSYPTRSASPNSQYTTNYSAFSASSPLPSTFNHYHHHPYPPHHQHSSHYDHPSSTTTTTTTPPPPPPPINLGGPLNNSIAGNSSIMARPLTAFLRENM